ncbi:hypothetical protein BHU11_07845 [Tannerella sp. oral taxon 808]|nr:hypothetical protein BHU11_07845 [Tannerella sp. oral taxon 808]
MESEIIASALFLAGMLSLGAAIYAGIRMMIKSDSREDFYRMKWETAMRDNAYKEESVKYREEAWRLRVELQLSECRRLKDYLYTCELMQALESLRPKQTTGAATPPPTHKHINK